MSPRASEEVLRSGTWIAVHTTPDEWEARLIRTAFINDGLRCKLQPRNLPSGGSEFALLVQEPDQADAMDLVDHVLNVLVSQPEPTEEPPAPRVIPEAEVPEDEPPVPRASPTAHDSVVVASREGIGEIVHHLGRGFELRVGPRPYYIVEEARWEEFTDFSAQRQEFAILLRAEYENLFQWVRENKLMGEFIKLVESTYRDVPPPRRRASSKPSLPVNRFATSSLVMSGIAACSVFLVVPWYVSLMLGLATIACGLVGRYQIGLNKDKQRGILIAMLGVGIACVVIAMALVTRQTMQSESVGYELTRSIALLG